MDISFDDLIPNKSASPTKDISFDDLIPQSAAPPAKSLAGFASNILPDARDQAAGIWNMLRHPIDTASSIRDVATGGITNGLNAVLPASMQIKPQNAHEQEMLDKANALGAQLKQSYGSADAIGNTLYNHPVGAAVDLASLVGGGEGLLRKAGMEGAADAAAMVNPMTLPTKAAGAISDMVTAPFNGRFNPQAVVDSRLGTLVSRSGQTPDQLNAIIKQAAQEGQPNFTLADALGKPGQNELSTVYRNPNDMQQPISDFLLNRQAGQGERLGSFLADASGTNKTAAQAAADATAARSRAGNFTYGMARNNAAPVDVSGTLGKIDQIIGPTKKFDVGIAPDSTEAMLSSIRQRLGVGAPQDGVTTRTDFNSLLGTKQDLADLRDSLYRQGKTNQANALKDVVKSLDGDLENASPAYRLANDTFAQMSRPIDAIEAGQAAASPSTRAADNIQQFQSLDTQPGPTNQPLLERQGFRTGYADSLQKKIEGSPMGVNKARPLSSDKIQAEMAAILQNPDVLTRQIGRENTMFGTQQRTLGGSQTFDNGANDSDLAGAVNAIKGGKSGILSHLLSKGIDLATGQSPQVREQLARILMSNDPTEHFNQLLGNSQSAAHLSASRRAALARILVGGQAGQQMNQAGSP